MTHPHHPQTIWLILNAVMLHVLWCMLHFSLPRNTCLLSPDKLEVPKGNERIPISGNWYSSKWEQPFVDLLQEQQLCSKGTSPSWTALSPTGEVDRLWLPETLRWDELSCCLPSWSLCLFVFHHPRICFPWIEEYWSVVSCMCQTGDQTQNLNMCPVWQLKMPSFWCTGQCSNWATPARAENYVFITLIFPVTSLGSVSHCWAEYNKSDPQQIFLGPLIPASHTLQSLQ